MSFRSLRISIRLFSISQINSTFLFICKDIELKFDELPDTSAFVEKRVEEVEPEDFEIHFGKYKGLTWPEIEKQDPGYLEWGKDKEGKAFDVLRKYLKEKGS